MHFVIWCCLIGLALGAPSEDDTDVDVAGKVVGSASKALSVYDETLDKVIPWEVFHQTSDELKKGVGRYSQASGSLVSEIITAFLNSENHYFSSTRMIYGWCGTSIPFLEGYVELFADFKKENVDAQKELMLEILDSGKESMNLALNHVNQSIVSFNYASGKLSELGNQLELDYQENSNQMEAEKERIRTWTWVGFIFPPVGLGLYINNEVNTFPKLKKHIEELKQFFVGLRGVVEKAIIDIDGARAKLKDEYTIITDMRSEVAVVRKYVALKATLKERVIKQTNKLIGQCEDYRRRHGERCAWC